MSKAENFIPFSVKNPKPLAMPDCIYLTERYKCGILNVRECLKELCSFSQNRADREESQIQWRRRLSEMEEGRQAKIAAVYYGGKDPGKSRTERNEVRNETVYSRRYGFIQRTWYLQN